MPLDEGIPVAVPPAMQLWFADNLLSSGAAEDSAARLEYLCTHGPRYGYFPNLAKSWYIYKEADEERAQEAFNSRRLIIQMTCGRIYLGGCIGSASAKEE